MKMLKSLCYAVLISSYVWLRKTSLLRKYRQLKKYPLKELLFSNPRVYQPVRHHWFFQKIVKGHLIWVPFSMVDSVALEEALLASTETIIATDGGRYDVHVRERKRFSVYWSEHPTEVRRCSWFYNKDSFGHLIPYEENLAIILEKEFCEAFESCKWYRLVELPNGHLISFHGPNTFVLNSQTQLFDNAIDPCESNYLLKRGIDDFDIENGETAQIDHLLFVVHGVGSACDLQFRSITEVVDDFRRMALKLVQSHFRTAFNSGLINKIEVLPICWHASVHYGDAGIDKKLKTATLPSIPFIRDFINDTLLDLFLYGDPTYCQTIITTVSTEMNQLYNLFKQRNPSFSGGVSVGGHSLGSLILFDLLSHQHAEQKDHCPTEAKTIALGRRMSSLFAQTSVQQPQLQYPELYFQPTAFFALGSPISMFATVRSVDELGANFKLPTCSHFFNIFHPTDPFAYRIEPLINPELAKVDPVLITHYKGRKRIHLGYDLIEWLMERLGIEESEALNLANQLCQYGYFFPVSDTKNLTVKDDSSLYRFQSPYYWPWQNRPPDNVEYAIYLAKRTLRNKQRHGLEDYELEALGNLRKNLANKWDFITMQAEEQVRLAKVLKKGDKIVSDSQERAYWRVHRPPPGLVSSLEQCPVPTRCRNGSRVRKRTIEDCRREVELLKNSLLRTRVKVSQALESMVQHVETYAEYDPLIVNTQPSNPWVSEDINFWQLNSPLVDVPTEKRVRRWALSMEELVSDPTGIQEFTNYLRKEYSHENIRFWMAVNDLRRSSQSQIQRKVSEIFEEFLAPGAPCEINIDGKTMEKVHQEMKSPSRFTFDAAQEHVYTLLLKKDCYPRFVRSEHYKNLLAAGVQPSQKKRFFGFGPTKKKVSTSSAPNPSLLQQQAPQGAAVRCSDLARRRGSDRSLSGSAHELAISGVKDTRVPHSHSQSNLSDIPYRGDLPCQSKGSSAPLPSPVKKPPSVAVVASVSTSEDVCPWESAPEPRSRKNSSAMDSCSSSSDVSAVVTEVSDRFRRTCGITQQSTLDGDRRGRKLSTASFVEQRRASVSVPIRHADVKLAVSSFEEGPATASDSDNKDEEVPSTKTFKKSSSLTKTCSVTGANAPIISVSSVTDDTVADPLEREEEPAASCSQPLAPLAEPDAESPGSEIPPEPEPSPDPEAKSNDVCPWEDEETCKVDAPFVKTYATLGYL